MADMLRNKKLDPIVIEIFIRGRKLSISLVSVAQSYFAVHYENSIWKFTISL